MSRIKWKNKTEIEQEKLTQEQLKAEKEQFKDKNFGNLATKDKDKLLEMIARDLGYL